MDMESTASSGRSTPALLNGHGGGGVPVGGGSTVPGGKCLSYTCCWDHCQQQFPSSPDLAEHIRTTHVDGQRGGVSVLLWLLPLAPICIHGRVIVRVCVFQVFVCLWKGCKVYNTPSTSQSWLQRHMLTHSGDKPFKVIRARPGEMDARGPGLD